MSISTAIQNLKRRVQDVYTTLSAKGAVIPEEKTTANLLACIESIPSNSDGLTTACYGRLLEDGTLEPWVSSPTEELTKRGNGEVKFDHIKKLSGTALFKAAFSIHMHAIEKVSFKNLQEIVGDLHFYQAFGTYSNQPTSFSYANSLGSRSRGDTALKIADFSSLEKIDGSRVFQYAFYRCQRDDLRVFFNKLKIVKGDYTFGYIFQLTGTPYNTRLNYLNKQRYFRALQEIEGNATFNGYVTMNTSTDRGYGYFPELHTVNSNGAYPIFYYCQHLDKWYFPKLNNISGGQTNSTKPLFQTCGATTEIHFGICNQTYIEEHDAYANKFGAPSTANIFCDLVNYITYNNVIYERFAPKDSEAYFEPPETDYFAWINGDDTIFTTTELNQTSIGDDVYLKVGDDFILQESKVSAIG